jgi:hypothetical protein
MEVTHGKGRRPGRPQGDDCRLCADHVGRKDQARVPDIRDLDGWPRSVAGPVDGVGMHASGNGGTGVYWKPAWNICHFPKSAAAVSIEI